MVGAVVIVVLLLIVFPVAVLMSGAVLSAVLGSLVKGGVDDANRDDDGAPNEHLQLSETNPYEP